MGRLLTTLRSFKGQFGWTRENAVAAWYADQYDASLDALVDLTGNGHHARFGSTVGADTNDPLLLPYEGEKYLYLPGTASNSVSTPNTTGGTAYYAITYTNGTTENGDTAADPVVIGGTAHSGSVVRVRVYSDSGRTTLVAEFDPSRSVEPHTSFVAATGETWTINRATTGRKAALVDRPLLLLGTDDRLEVPDHADLNFDADTDFTLFVAMRAHHAQNYKVFLGKRLNSTNTNPGYAMLDPNNALRSLFETRGGGVNADANLNFDSTTPIGGSASYKGRREGTQLTVWRGAEGRTLTVTAIDLRNNEPLRIGGDGASATFDMEFIGAAIFRRALTEAELSRVAAEFGIT